MSKELKRVAALSMVAGSIGPLLLFIFVIIGHDPWYARNISFRLPEC